MLFFLVQGSIFRLYIPLYALLHDRDDTLNDVTTYLPCYCEKYTSDFIFTSWPLVSVSAMKRAKWGERNSLTAISPQPLLELPQLPARWKDKRVFLSSLLLLYRFLDSPAEPCSFILIRMFFPRFSGGFSQVNKPSHPATVSEYISPKPFGKAGAHKLHVLRGSSLAGDSP